MIDSLSLSKRNSHNLLWKVRERERERERESGKHSQPLTCRINALFIVLAQFPNLIMSSE